MSPKWIAVALVVAGLVVVLWASDKITIEGERPRPALPQPHVILEPGVQRRKRDVAERVVRVMREQIREHHKAGREPDTADAERASEPPRAARRSRGRRSPHCVLCTQYPALL